MTTTIEQIFTNAEVDVEILGNVSGNTAAEDRKAEIVKLASAINKGMINKSKIVEYIKSIPNAKLSAAQVSKWLEDVVPVVKRGEGAVEAPVTSGNTYKISELEWCALEAIKRDAGDIWEQALKDGFQIKKDKQMKELEEKLDAERDALLEKLTKPAN
ncbi:hypothetical protein ABK933_03535 [Klebsiella aerogenes]|uniref:hypothetical protein n=1 Tax=Klebsiella aerogenes TaxID=548 RepID=UPI0037516109